jgi:RHS repeat-associated protein
MKTGAAYYTYQNDHLGTPMKLLNQSGVVVWSATYDAFGKATVDPASTITNNLRFPGQYADTETGLHYNWYRYYDPNTGRYSTSDPIGLRGGMNTYAYVGGKPIIRKDPKGLEDWPDFFPPMPPGCDPTNPAACTYYPPKYHMECKLEQCTGDIVGTGVAGAACVEGVGCWALARECISLGVCLTTNCKIVFE